MISMLLFRNCFLPIACSWLAGGVAANTTTVINDTCASDTAALYDGGADGGESDVETAFYNFIDLLHDTCGTDGTTACNLPNDDDYPPRFVKTLDYAPLANDASSSYGDYVRECEEVGGSESDETSKTTVLCTMDAEYTSVEGSPAGIVSIFDSTTTRFRSVPVCIPAKCTTSEDDVRMALPRLFQNFASDSSSASINFTCPEDDEASEAAGAGSCGDDLPLIENTTSLEYYSSTSSRLFLDVAESCFTETYVGSPSDTCSIELEDPDHASAVLSIDLEEIRTEPEFEEYREACVDATGQFCAASISVEFPGSAGGYSYFNVSVRNFPFCYARSCEGGTDSAEDVAKDFLFAMGMKLLSNGNVRHLFAENAPAELLTTGTGDRSLETSLGEMMERRCGGGEGASQCKFEVENLLCGNFVDQHGPYESTSGASSTRGWTTGAVMVAIAGIVMVAIAGVAVRVVKQRNSPL